MDLSVTLAAAIAVAAVMFVLWLVSLAAKDASIVDIVWGPLFVIIAWVSYLVGDAGPAMLLVAALVTVWGLRLAFFIGRRNLGHGEDRRYQKMRQKRPEYFWIWSLFAVFMLQGFLALVVSLPLPVARGSRPRRDRFRVGPRRGRIRDRPGL